MSRFDAGDVRRYYDRHTPAFLRFGQAGGIGSIHRAVWGPGVMTRVEAFHHVDERIADLAQSLVSAQTPSLHIVDLGCGVGASLHYLAERLPMRGTGVTLSPVQCRIASERARAAGLADRVRCIEGDYTALPSEVDRADLAYAIESFVHGPSPEQFFAECARLVRPGGLLVICDDVRGTVDSVAATRAVDRFCRGWHVNSLLDPETLRALAHAAGFEQESSTDLTPWLELRRLRDRAIAVPAAMVDGFCRVTRPVLGPALLDRINRRYGHLLGGSALQTCLARGWVSYRCVAFRRV